MRQDDVVSNVHYLERYQIVEFNVDGMNEKMYLCECAIRKNDFKAKYDDGIHSYFLRRQVQGQAAKTAIYNALPKLVPES